MDDHERRLTELTIAQLEATIHGDEGILAYLDEYRTTMNADVYERQKRISTEKIATARAEIDALRRKLAE